ncbi:hypothetical protein Taro_013963 [Colocasia esculenta]|uniref:Uncharacterized protein n=1 Tax=Colocasia esculenta TaxID=4460 RepID=A0A843UNR2_COLES|nr:hypothetical protein [Colocasia esculenta]
MDEDLYKVPPKLLCEKSRRFSGVALSERVPRRTTLGKRKLAIPPPLPSLRLSTYSLPQKEKWMREIVLKVMGQAISKTVAIAEVIKALSVIVPDAQFGLLV